MKDVRVYNLASPGSSLAGRLALLLKKPNLLDGIDPSIPTVIIYVFLDDHLRRMAGTSELFKRGDFHYYESPWFSVKNNELVLNWGYDKDFWSFRWLIQMYAKTNFSRLTKLELPPISTKHYEMQGKILERLHLEVSKKLPKTVHTFVATFPGENHRIQEISPYLKDATLLDYSGFDFQNLLPHAQFYLAGDYHPHPRVYELFSMLLANDLNNQL